MFRRLAWIGGELRFIEEPAIHVPAGLYAVRVRFFVVDDYSGAYLGERVSRVALGTLVHGPRSLLGRYVVAVGDDVAGEVAVAREVAPVNGPDPRYALLPYVDQVRRAVARVPRGVPVSVVGRDPRAEIVREVAEVGESKWVLVLDGGELAGEGCRAVVLGMKAGLGRADRCVVRLMRRVRAVSGEVPSIELEVVDAEPGVVEELARAGRWAVARLK